MAKLSALFFVALFLCFTFANAARPLPSNTQHGVVQTERDEAVDESCDGVTEEECLMRRTLAAHIDYIYTQKHKP
ncbi:hypothetical protein L6164_027941 [Bauhinia variegata]|uniref:Uncharacterized protein n=1 Tax=Bauhinia variegata TaxID=167791 RepID=A0ACB9LW28_BAUVA|nr:hypothetical protein L6164_027941 [Bauhinia variegata]